MFVLFGSVVFVDIVEMCLFLLFFLLLFNVLVEFEIYFYLDKIL